MIPKILYKISNEDYEIAIEEGCLLCHTCQTECPEIFNVTADGVKFTDDAADWMGKKYDSVYEAALGCPHEIIHPK